MKLCRVTHKNFENTRYAFVEDGKVWPIAEGQQFNGADLRRTEGSFLVEDVKLLAPVVPSKIVCVGRNYREHAAELGNKMPDEPLLF